MAKRKNFPKERNIATKESLFGLAPQTKAVDLPELGQVVLVREMNALELGRRTQKLLNNQGQPDRKNIGQIGVDTVLNQVIDGEGNRLFTPTDRAQIEQLPGGVINRITKAVNEMSGIREVDNDSLSEWLAENYPAVLAEYEETLDPVETAEENFTITPSGASPTV